MTLWFRSSRVLLSNWPLSFWYLSPWRQWQQTLTPKLRDIELSPFDQALKEVTPSPLPITARSGTLMASACRSFKWLSVPLKQTAISMPSHSPARLYQPENSDVWRTRFLARYDYPFITSPWQYCAAYRLRRFVLRTISGLEHDGDEMVDAKARSSSRFWGIFAWYVIDSYFRSHHFVIAC